MNVVEKIQKRTRLNQADLSRRLGITAQALVQWRNNDKVPADRVAQICEIAGFLPWEISNDFNLEKIYQAKAFFDSLEESK